MGRSRRVSRPGAEHRPVAFTYTDTAGKTTIVPQIAPSSAATSAAALRSVKRVIAGQAVDDAERP